MKFYEVKFMTKKGGEQIWAINVEASQKAAALLKVKKMWESDPRLCGMHRFQITGRVLKDTEEFWWHYFTKVDSWDA